MKKTIILALCLFCPAAFAAVQGAATSPDTFTLTISGPLASADAVQLDTLLTTAKPEQAARRLLVLDSEGGDPEAAMKMGRTLHNLKFGAQVKADGKCLSSCVFLLAAATEQQVAGKVGVFRPAAPAGVDTAPYNADMPNRFRKYFAELGTPVDLAELMVNTPPAKPHMLSEHELVFFHLNTPTDLQYREDDNVAMAKKMHLTLAQYLQFKELLLYKCDVYKDDAAERSKCLDAAYRNFLPSPGN